jgi:hypothetical protein
MQSTLYSFAAPAMFFLLPLMDLSVSDVGAYIKGTEFRTFMGEILIQVISGVTDAFLAGIVAMLFP